MPQYAKENVYCSVVTW